MALIFEHETCGRCGGTGHYSYNQISGTRCFGCNGAKDRLTKRGRAAQDFFNALRTVKRDDVKVGDRVIADCYFSGRYNAEVTSIQPDTLNPQHVTLHLRELPRKDGAKLREMNYGALVTCTFQRVLSKQEYADNVAKALEYQATLTKMGKPKSMRRCTTCDARLYGGEYGRCSDCINAPKVVLTDEQIDRAQDDARLVAEFPLSDQTPNNEE